MGKRGRKEGKQNKTESSNGGLRRTLNKEIKLQQKQPISCRTKTLHQELHLQPTNYRLRIRAAKIPPNKQTNKKREMGHEKPRHTKTMSEKMTRSTGQRTPGNIYCTRQENRQPIAPLAAWSKEIRCASVQGESCSRTIVSKLMKQN